MLKKESNSNKNLTSSCLHQNCSPVLMKHVKNTLRILFGIVFTLATIMVRQEYIIEKKNCSEFFLFYLQNNMLIWIWFMSPISWLLWLWPCSCGIKSTCGRQSRASHTTMTEPSMSSSHTKWPDMIVIPKVILIRRKLYNLKKMSFLYVCICFQ